MKDDHRTGETIEVLPIMRQTARVCCFAAQPKAVALALLVSAAETFGAEYGNDQIAGWLQMMASSYADLHPIKRPDSATVQ